MSGLLFSLLPQTTQVVSSGEEPINPAVGLGLMSSGQLGKSTNETIGNTEFTQQFQLMRQQLNQQINLTGKGLPQLDPNLVKFVQNKLSDAGHKLSSDFQLEVINDTGYTTEDIVQLLSTNTSKLSTSDREQILTNIKIHLTSLTTSESNTSNQSAMKSVEIDKIEPLNLGQILSKNGLPSQSLGNLQANGENHQVVVKDSLLIKGATFVKDSQIVASHLTETSINKATLVLSGNVDNEFSPNKVAKEVNDSVKPTFSANKFENLVKQDFISQNREKLAPIEIGRQKEVIDKPFVAPAESLNKNELDKLQQLKPASEKLAEMPNGTLNKLSKAESNLNQLANLINPAQTANRVETPSLYTSAPIHPASIESLTAANTNPPVVANTNFQSGLALRNDFSPNLAARIQWIYSQAVSSAEIMMDPAELGPMNVKMKTTNGETNILFQVTNLQTKEMIEDNLSKLRELLSEQGINLGDTHVKQESQDNQDSENSNSNLADIEDIEDEASQKHQIVQEGILDAYI